MGGEKEPHPFAERAAAGCSLRAREAMPEEVLDVPALGKLARWIGALRCMHKHFQHHPHLCKERPNKIIGNQQPVSTRKTTHCNN
jgi:hypothetical protein